VSRILPFKRPTLDYSLWREISNKSMNISEEEIKFIVPRDTTKSAQSKFWNGEGRSRTRNDPKLVIDFIGLNNKLARNWSTIKRLEGPNLLEKIEKKLRTYPGGDFLADRGIDETWLDIDWGLLGRVVGAALANEGARQGFWRQKGNDAKISNDFWLRIKDKMNSSFGFGIITSEDWLEEVGFSIDRGLDPEAEITRGGGHGPTIPVYSSTLEDKLIYWINPLVLMHRNMMREIFSGKEAEDADEYAIFHGELTFSLIRKAIDVLDQGNYAEFILMIHGMCAHHIMRTSLMQQKIGMHLITNLAIRDMTRDVVALPVPDLAQDLKTGFSFGRILSILYKSKIIEWYTVDANIVHDAISELKSR